MPTITREDLYREVWSRPLKEIAADRSTSYHFLIKACRVLHVPRPKAGHWNLVEVGKPPRPPGLPDLPADAPSVMDLRPLTAKPRQASPAPAGPIRPLKRHPLLSQSRGALRGARIDHNGLLVPAFKQPCLAIKVSPAQLDRALRVFGVVLATAREVGGDVVVEWDDYHRRHRTTLKIEGETVELQLRERLRTERRLATEDDRPFMTKVGDVIQSLRPSGQLKLALVGLERTGARQRWADGTSTQLEAKLPGLADALRSAAAVLKAQRAEREEFHRLRRERQQREADRRLEQERQKALAAQLWQMERRWRAANRLRDFLEAAARSVPPEARPPMFQDWLVAARQYANAMDPLETPEKATTLLTQPDELTWYREGQLGGPPAQRQPGGGEAPRGLRFPGVEAHDP